MPVLANFLRCAILAMLLGICTPTLAQHYVADAADIRAQLEQQAGEIRELRALLNERERPAAVQPIFSAPASYFQDAGSSDIESRLKALEEQLQKANNAAEEKKEEDAQKPTIKPRMRLHTDAAWIDQSELNRATLGDIQNGTYFRRARLGFDAQAFGVTEYRLDFEMGSGGGRPNIFDGYLRVTELPLLQNVQVGHFREPFSLEAQTSSNWYTFAERAPITAFDPSRNWGIMTFGATERQNATWSTGIFRDGSDNFGDDIGESGERAVTARLTWLPYYDEPSDGRYYFHLGVSGSYREPDKNNPGGFETSRVSYGSTPEINLNEDNVGGVPDFVNTGNLADAHDIQLGGVEAALIWGSFSLQGEYVGSYVDRTDNLNPWFHGGYVQASYFLTGEYRPYNRSTGMFDRTDVLEPFFRVRTDEGICTGRGAWEIAARWSYLDLNDGGVNGGYLDDTNIGLNWYLNSYARLMFNYIYADLHDPQQGRSNSNIFLTRISVFY